MKAVISDIHGNLEALNAVLKDIASRRIQEVVCLGDVVGYGPNPRECLELLLKCRPALKGNHEHALLYDPDGFNEKAEAAILWTRDQLNDAASYDRDRNYELWDFLGALEDAVRLDGVLFVHASPVDPVMEYVLPRDAADAVKMKRLFSAFTEELCLCGHTHVPGVFLPDCRFLTPKELPGGQFIRDGRRAILNVGSVGQPRDGDPRASYVTFDRTAVWFHRVPYDYRKTQEKIRLIPALPAMLADRLEKGR